MARSIAGFTLPTQSWPDTTNRLQGGTYGTAQTATAFFETVGDLLFQDVKLLLNTNGSNGSTTFTDSSTSALAVTANGNAQISTAQSYAGGASALFDGTGDFLSFTSISIGSSIDATLEAWIYPTSVTDRCVFGQATGTNIQLLSILSGQLNCFWNGNNLTGGTVVVNQWQHVAVTRASGIIRLFVNGQLVATSTSNTQAVGVSQVGRGVFRGDFAGHIDEVRVTVGTARYTANFNPRRIELSATPIATGAADTAGIAETVDVTLAEGAASSP
jgi:hypothetical protein